MFVNRSILKDSDRSPASALGFPKFGRGRYSHPGAMSSFDLIKLLLQGR